MVAIWEALAIIVTIIAGIFAIIGGLFASFKTDIGRRFWKSVGSNLLAFLKLIWRLRTVLLFVEIFLIMALVAYLLWWPPQTKSIEGKIYYERSQEKPDLDPVPYVTVFLSKRPELKSATDLEGNFIIRGVPADFQVTHLTARRDGQDFPTEYRKTGDYAIIPRQPARDIDTPWKVSTGQCLTNNGQQVRKTKQYTLDMILPADGKQAFLTVELDAASDAMILNAFVLWPPVQSGRYRNAIQGLDEATAHRWLFTLPQTELRIKLEVCLGSNDPSAILSQEHLHTYYEFR